MELAIVIFDFVLSFKGICLPKDAEDKFRNPVSMARSKYKNGEDIYGDESQLLGNKGFDLLIESIAGV
jgi:hypothetical protein